MGINPINCRIGKGEKMKNENIQPKKTRTQINFKKMAAQAAVTFAQGALFAAGGLLINRLSAPGNTQSGDFAGTDSNILPMKKQVNS